VDCRLEGLEGKSAEDRTAEWEGALGWAQLAQKSIRSLFDYSITQ